MYTYQEVENALDRESLSDALYKMERLARGKGFIGLARWCSHELKGYFGSTKEEKEASHEYRTIAVEWRDIYHRPAIVSPQLSFVQSMPLREGVSEIEGFLENGMFINYPDIVEILQPHSTVPIAGAYMPPEQLKALLKRIRLVARSKFHDSIPRIPNMSTGASELQIKTTNDEANRTSNAVSDHHYSALWEKILAATVASLIFALVGWLVIRNQPFADPNLVVGFRIVLSVAAAILGATIPGFLHLDWKGRGLAIRSGGALALFVLSYIWSPNVIQSPPSTHNQLYLIRVTVIDPQGIPVDDARVWSSIGGEPKKVAGGWQFDIPVQSKPIDGQVTFFASKDAGTFVGQRTIV
jgi:hypothetical protein